MQSGSRKTKYDIFIENKIIPIDAKKKIYILISILIVPLVIFYFSLYKPNTEKIEKLELQVQNSSEELKKVRKAARDLPKYQKELELAQSKFESTSVLLPKSQEIPNLLRNISDLGKGAGLDFLSFVPGPETPKDFYSEIPIDIKIKGPYHNLGAFLDTVSKLERIVTVNNIKTENPEQGSGEMLLTSSCKLVTYRFTNVKLPPADNKKKKK
jgi:type IV pilus assembly protein PilO